MLYNHAETCRAQVEHFIGHIKNKYAMATTGLARRPAWQADMLWFCAVALHNRCLRLYGSSYKDEFPQ